MRRRDPDQEECPDLERFNLGGKWPPKAELMADAARLGGALLRRMVPPLALEDVIPIVGLEIAAFRLVPVLPPREQINSFAKDHCETVGIKLAGEVSPGLAHATRFLPYLIVPDDGDLLAWVQKRYHQWVLEVLTPAMAGPFCARPDLSVRGQAVRAWRQRHFAMSSKPDFHETVKRLENAYFDSYGVPRNDKNKPGRFQGIAPTKEKRVRGAQGCLELLFKIQAPGEELFVIEGGRLTVNQRSATQELRKAVGADKRMHSKIVKSRALPHRPHEGVPPEVVEALRELRDLRDATDLQRTHPQLHLLSQAIESLAAQGNPRAPRDVVYLRLLVQRVEHEKDPSFKAALVYEGLGGNKDQQEPMITRGAVAKHYRVTARKIETRAAQARWEVQRLVQLAS